MSTQEVVGSKQKYEINEVKISNLFPDSNIHVSVTNGLYRYRFILLTTMYFLDMILALTRLDHGNRISLIHSDVGVFARIVFHLRDISWLQWTGWFPGLIFSPMAGSKV